MRIKSILNRTVDRAHERVQLIFEEDRFLAVPALDPYASSASFTHYSGSVTM